MIERVNGELIKILFILMQISLLSWQLLNDSWFTNEQLLKVFKLKKKQNGVWKHFL